MGSAQYSSVLTSTPVVANPDWSLETGRMGVMIDPAGVPNRPEPRHRLTLSFHGNSVCGVSDKEKGALTWKNWAC